MKCGGRKKKNHLKQRFNRAGYIFIDAHGKLMNNLYNVMLLMESCMKFSTTLTRTRIHTHTHTHEHSNNTYPTIGQVRPNNQNTPPTHNCKTLI